MKKIFLVILILILLLLIAQLGVFYWRVRIGRGLAAVAKRYERVLPEATYRMLIIGDSTAYGTGVLDPNLSVAGLFGKNFPTISLVNLGENGRRTASVAGALQEFPDNSFDLILIHTGGNDIVRFTPLSELKTSLTNALATAKQKGKRVVILHSGNVGAAPMFRYPLGWLFTDRTRKVRELYLKKTKELDVMYVDLFTEAAEDPFLADVKNSYAADGLHLGPRGNEIWFAKIMETLKRNDVVLP